MRVVDFLALSELPDSFVDENIVLTSSVSDVITQENDGGRRLNLRITYGETLRQETNHAHMVTLRCGWNPIFNPESLWFDPWWRLSLPIFVAIGDCVVVLYSGNPEFDPLLLWLLFVAILIRFFKRIDIPYSFIDNTCIKLRNYLFGIWIRSPLFHTHRT
jgi:hypothetical protein